MASGDLLPERLDLPQVAEGLHSPHDPPVFVPEEGGGDAHGNLFVIRGTDVDVEVDHRLPGFHGVAQGAGFIADVGAEDGPARRSDGLFPGEPGDFLGGPVEAGDLTLEVDAEHAIGDAGQHGFEAARGKRVPRYAIRFRHRSFLYCSAAFATAPASFPAAPGAARDRPL